MSRAHDLPSLAAYEAPAPVRARAWAGGFAWTDRVAIVLLAALLVLFSRVPYLPMVDLPQHAAQLTMWIHHADPGFPEARRFEVNWHTPYLTAYALARLVAPLAGPVGALKLVVWGAVAAHYLAFRRLVRALGHPRCTELLGLITALGYPFFYGFVSFLVALPLAVATIAAAVAHREQPTRRHGVALAALAAATLVSHGFAFGMAMLFVGALLLAGRGAFLARVAPLAAPALLWLTWVLPGAAIRSIGATIWRPRLLELAQAPALLFASSGVDGAASALGYAALGLVALVVGRPRRELLHWAPLAFLLGGYCLFPVMLSGFGPLHPRFAALLLPALLLAFAPRRERRGAGLLAGALAFGWFTLFTVRLARWDLEARPFAHIVEELPAHLRVRPVVFHRDSEAFPGLPAHLHLTAYYQVAKGGTQGYSFAMYPTSAVRYVPGTRFGMGSGEEWHPESFSFPAESTDYDVFLVHSRWDPTSLLFTGHEGEVVLVARHGDWRAYRVASSPIRGLEGAGS